MDLYGGEVDSDGLQGWFRYFQVPGMQHVQGTANDAPWYFAGAGANANIPSSSEGQGQDDPDTLGFVAQDASHDALLALMAWVENGTPVDKIVATTWKRSQDPFSGVFRQRPLCPYPKRQAYIGGEKGDSDRPESFECQ